MKVKDLITQLSKIKNQEAEVIFFSFSENSPGEESRFVPYGITQVKEGYNGDMDLVEFEIAEGEISG